MPNGGPDCCGNCSFNVAVQEMAHPHPEPLDKFRELSHCTLRDVKISNPFWTYCPNFEYGKHPESRDINAAPRGRISSSGLYEGYVRIPWDGLNEPQVSVPTTCSVCEWKTESGIEIVHDGKTLGFCTNRHYVKWWKTIYQDDSLRTEDYEPPSKRYGSR